MRRRTIAVLTTSRADYGLLRATMRAIAHEPSLRLSVIACGSHLDRSLGLTMREITSDGFAVAARVASKPAGDDALAVARALGRAACGFAAAYARLKPDLLVALGDRWELLAACSAAVAAGVPIAHLHGGESSEGVIDEQVRHAVTKLAHLHLPAAELYRRRILQMGEEPRRVVLTGAPGLENLAALAPESRAELEGLVGLSLDEPFVVATCHSETAGRVDLSVLNATLGAIDALRLRAVVTLANADAGGATINRRVLAWARSRRGRAAAVASLGADGYPSLLRLASAVIGNSSSGIIEAPFLRVPTVNVGDRQKGRLRAPSVIDCRATPRSVAAALRRALSPAFRRRCRGASPYRGGPVSARVVAAILRALKDPRLPRKSFRDLPWRHP
jgi:UDP-hydrolysing UDP-N-acetyl-D-glucosamine 2-epimerase